MVAGLGPMPQAACGDQEAPAPGPALRPDGWRVGESAADAFARAAAAPEGAPPRDPLAAYHARLQTLEEFERTAVPLEEAPARLRGVLEEHGFAVVTGVIKSARELHELEEDFKADLMELVDLDGLSEAPDGVRGAFDRFAREGPYSFPLATALGHLTQAAGFVLRRCLSHGRLAWRVRRHPRVHAAFRSIFGAGDLVTSLDVTFFTPAGQEAAASNRFTAHCDQNASDVRPGLSDAECYQGVLYVWPSAPDGRSSTTVVWPGSHRSVWPRMMEDRGMLRYGSGGLHYCEVKSMASRAEAKELARGWAEHARRVVVPPGGLLLWNSRTVHTGWVGGPRLAQAVCLEPVGRRPEPERLAKLRLASLGLPACHWAQAGMQHDMSIGAPGYFEVERVEAKDGEEHRDVVLPLRGACRPAALAPDADVEELARLVQVEWRLCGMWDPPEECTELLEASVRDDFKRYL